LELIDKAENEKITGKKFGLLGKYKHYALGAGFGLLSFILFVISKKLVKF